MKPILYRSFSCLLLTLILTPALNSQTQLIQEIIDRVSVDSLRTHVRTLADDTSFQYGGQTYRISGRNDSTGRKLARLYLKPQLDSFGLAARLDTFGLALPYAIAEVNILAEQRGVVEPDVRVIIGAHYDTSISGIAPAPGADMDASGCAAVLEAARLLSQYKTHYTVVYAIWDQCEQGRFGSISFVNRARSNGDSLRGYINIDQIGWDSLQALVGEVWIRPYGQSEALGDSLMALSKRFNTGATMLRIDPALNSDDHTSFWLKGYSAVSIHEESYGGNWNPYGGLRTDRVEHLNFTSLCARARFAVASIAWLAGLEGPLSVESGGAIPTRYALHQNYPNPFNPATTIGFSLPERTYVTLTVYNTLGQKVATLVNGEIEPGDHERTFNAGRLASGVYYCRLHAGSFTQVRPMLFVR
jgi:hypothetical protein